jgi:glycosyltransferase involved in cell wall biosynthesis
MLNLDARERAEAWVLDAIDAVGTTSSTIESALREDYGYTRRTIFLPPCVDPHRFFPGEGRASEETAQLLADHSSRTTPEIASMRIITEISRTDHTKRKDLLLDVVAALIPRYSDVFLALTIDSRQEDIARELRRKIGTLGIHNHVAVLGNIAPAVPDLLRSTYVYVTPSEMEGFGMSLQEAAACGVPAVASDLVPFAVEYLAGDDCTDQRDDTGHHPGAFVVSHGKTEQFVAAVATLLEDRAFRDRMGAAARTITVPAFTWRGRLTTFLDVVTRTV